MYDEMTKLFEAANRSFLSKETHSIVTGVSERNLCGCLMMQLRIELDKTTLKQYHVDVEYNRKQDGRLKTIIAGNLTPITVCCDLIVHSRSECVAQDNLIALEMKRNTHSKAEKDKDKIRLKHENGVRPYI